MFEARIGERVCQHLGGRQRVLEQRDPPHPDLVIGDATPELAVELCRYRAQTASNQRYERDYLFKKDARDLLNAETPASGGSMVCSYRTVGGLARVPSKADTPAIAAELLRVALETRTRSTLDSRALTSLGHPLLAEHFLRVTVVPEPEGKWWRLSTSLDTYFGARLDQLELRRMLKNKKERAPGYRTSTPLPIYLVIHADGSPPSSQVPDGLLERMLELIQEELSGADFDRVFLLRDALCSNGGTMIEVDIPRGLA